MATSFIPRYTVSQTSTHVHLEIKSAACTQDCSPRAVVDSGNVFGIACQHFHLPFIFPNEALVDGSATLGQIQQGSAIILKKDGSAIDVDLLKQKPGEVIEDLEDLKPSVFPLLEDDEEGRDEERLFGLAMLQRGVDVMRAQGNHTTTPNSTSKPAPRPPRVPLSAKTKVHECFSEEIFVEEERRKRTVAAYEQEEKRWDEGMYLDNFVDEDGEVKHLIEATLELPSGRDVFERRGLAPCTLQRDMHLLLLELFLAQAYDYRTTSGDSTVESAWTICSLSRSLVSSCLPSSRAGDIVLSTLLYSLRRQLSFPLYRNWKLSIKVCEDVVTSLRTTSCRSLLSTIGRLLDNESEDEAMQVYLNDVVGPLISNFDQYFR
jgi:hypothetical protein